VRVIDQVGCLPLNLSLKLSFEVLQMLIYEFNENVDYYI